RPRTGNRCRGRRKAGRYFQVNMWSRSLSPPSAAERPVALASVGQLLAGPFADDVLGVPVRPVCVVSAGPLLVLAMRGGGAPECGGKIGRRGKGRLIRADTSGQ